MQKRLRPLDEMSLTTTTKLRRMAVFARTPVILFAVLTITAVIFSPGLSGGFAFDDYPNIVNNPSITDGDMSFDSLTQVVWTGNAGPLKRPISMLSFAFNYHFSGIAPFGFKLTNLIIHLLNGLLVFWLGSLILRGWTDLRQVPYSTRETGCALAVTALWLVHPLNLTSVLYVVQRMNSLSAMLTFLAVICFCIGRFRLIAGRGRGNLILYLGFSGFCAIGVLSKENALLALPLIAVLELGIFRLRAAQSRDRMFLIAFYGIVLIAPLALIAQYTLFEPEWLLNRYDKRPFSLLERGLTESRVIWFYISMLVLPRLGVMGLYHDDFAVSTGLFEPVSTVFALLSIGVVAVAALVSIRRFPIFSIAILWFAIGHWMESTIYPLELIHEHRNYLPSFGFVLGAVVGIAELSRIANISWLPKFGGVSAFLILAFLTFMRAGDWSDPITLATIEAERNPESFRTVYELGRARYGAYLMRNDEQAYVEAIAALEHSAELDLSAKRPLAELIRISYLHGDQPKLVWKDELIRRYAETYFHYTEWVVLNKMVQCNTERPRDCAFPPDMVLDTFTAALSNASVPGWVRANVMVDLGRMYVNSYGDFVPAIALFDDAIRANPNKFTFRETRAEALILSGHLENAARAIDELEKPQRWEEFFVTPPERVQQLKNHLKKAQALADKDGPTLNQD